VDEVEQIDALKERCRKDLKFLVTEVFKRKRWDDNLHGGLVQVLEAPGDRKLILLPRGHQKSETVSVAWVIQQLLRDPNTRIKIISATWTLAKNIAHQIKGLLEDSDLKTLYGEFFNRKTRKTIEYFDIAQKTRKTIDPTLSTGGITTGKTGSHCDILIFDDVVAPENSTTPELIRKTIDGYKDTLPLLDPGGIIVVIGTRYSLGDLYGYLIEEESQSINGHYFETEEERKLWRKWVK
jgi:hypothetical protein